MSEEQQPAAELSRKEKRAQRDAERKGASKRGKKRKAIETEEDAGDNEFKDDFVALPELDENDIGAKSKDTVSKKRKRDDESKKQTSAATDPAEKTAQTPAKKKRKPIAAQSTATEDGDSTAIKAKPANQRFIVFVGNLPYATTDASLQTHFKSLQPFTLRHRTDPKTKKSKGFAFLEFENFDRMKTCLKLYHHSYFDPESPEKSKLASDGEPEPEFRPRGRGKPKEKGRKINVELTAGGGGGAENRKEKIRVKNVRLEEQRERRKEVERKEKLNKERKGGDGAKKGANAEEPAAAANAEGMHPARLAMMGR